MTTRLAMAILCRRRRRQKRLKKVRGLGEAVAVAMKHL
ncbi:hypothetical protein TT_C1269 [Thermus thermophilus HB27]|uniref:Uncharacterized protein n=1 Tax=Thermus thermophilus (strain ATCC BAA-163 / DSM 7039 / HB27) TaxID=262724 RepID=Q72I63_THET2|nr:hypothetical protein TT_C1269 [Thermus thermophilus HB27]